MKIALVYDRVNKWGGAERILEILHEIWPEAPLFTAVYNRETAPWADKFDVQTTFIQKIPLAKRKHEWFPWLITIGFENLNLREYDVVISITSAEAKGVITCPETLHICYCLTPTRYLWSHKDIYLSQKGQILKFLMRPVLSFMRLWDQVAAARPDYYLSISGHIQKRVKKYYRRESKVIYPPLTFGIKNWQLKTGIQGLKFQNFFLVVSRLVSYKRIDIAIEACNRLKLPLVIIGEGSEKSNLQKIAGETITFIYNLTDQELLRYYQNCQALIMPQEEDFGLVSIEAQSFGKPVIAFNDGGAKETIINGKTGEFFNEQSVLALEKILANFNIKKYNNKDIQKHAGTFNKEKFKKEFVNFVEEKYSQHLKTIRNII